VYFQKRELGTCFSLSNVQIQTSRVMIDR